MRENGDEKITEAKRLFDDARLEFPESGGKKKEPSLDCRFGEKKRRKAKSQP